MKLYIDEDSAHQLLVKLLRQAGHDVVTCQEADKIGDPDVVQLTHAVRENRTLLTRNHRDFTFLHNLIVAADGRHPGLLVERHDNDPSRDLTARGIVHAIGKIESAGEPLENRLHVLNRWR